MLTQGGAAFERGQVEAAEAVFRRAVAVAPESPQARTNLAVVLGRQGRWEEARRELEVALELAPERAEVHLALGAVAAGQGQDHLAVDHYGRALELAPGSHESRFQRAQVLRRLGRLDEAAAALEELVTRDRDRPEPHLALALVRMQQEHWAAALAALETGLLEVPGDRLLTQALARLLAACPDRSLRDGVRALALTHTVPDHRKTVEDVETQAMALAQLGRFPQAVGLLETALEPARRSSRPQLVTRLEADLTRYRRGETAAAPWPAGDPVLAPKPAGTPP